ncbi:hypothetical protein D3C75_1370610 [compost metagenome]
MKPNLVTRAAEYGEEVEVCRALIPRAQESHGLQKIVHERGSLIKAELRRAVSGKSRSYVMAI